MRKLSLLIIACLVLISLLSLEVSPGTAQAGSASDLIDAVNQLRAANGLPPYRTDPILMGTAQGQSDYQAAVGSIQHEGPGGSRPRDRAIAAGYGGGATVFISENIAGGIDLSVEQTVSMWQGDAPHLNTMLGANYTDIGAGVAVSDNFVYYTIDVGYVAGGSEGHPPASTPLPGGTPQPTQPLVVPIRTATPMPDGSIVHVVQWGQFPITIAKAYGISLEELLKLNDLKPTPSIYVGQKLIIRAAFTPTATEPTATASPTATATRRPTRTPTLSPPTPTPTTIETDAPVTATPSPIAQATDPVGKSMLIMIGVLGVSGAVLLVVGGILKRRT